METIKRVYESFRIKLITTMPMNDVLFSSLLREQNLLPSDLGEQVQTKATRTEKATWFLDKAIEPYIYIGDVKPLRNLLATIIKEELDEEILFATS